jgi:hypothetical protein
MKKYIDKIKEFWNFLENNKILITSSVYWLWIAFQLIMLMSYSGFQWFFYVSLKFSIIIFIILLFLFLLSIPSFVIFLIWLLWIFMFWLWSWWIIWKIVVITYFISLFLSKFILKKFFPKKLRLIQKKIKNSKFDKFTIHYWVLIFIVIFISFWYSVFWKKIVVLNTQDNKAIMWELKFYNQEYYFLDVCNNKIILPAGEVKSVNMLWDRFYFSQKENKWKLDKITNDYKKYCTIKNIKIIK